MSYCLIPDRVEDICNEAFSGCTNLKTASFNAASQLTEIGARAFYHSGLISISIPDGVTEINTEVFSGCDQLLNCYIPNNVTKIWSQVFYGCKNLTSIVIPDKVTYFGENLFIGASLKEIIVENPALLSNVKLSSYQDILRYEPQIDYLVLKCDDGSRGEVMKQRVVRGTTAMNPIVSHNGYGLKYWHLYDDEDNAFDFNTTITSSKVLFAKWEEGKHTIFFVTNGGSQIANECVANNAIATKPTDPVLERYQLAGWYTDAALNNAYNFETPVTSDLILYAKWELKANTVTFNSNEGSSVDSQTIEYNTIATKPADPTREHYVFKGWYTDTELNNVYNFETPVVEDLTLFAKWEACKYSVVFSSNEGSSVDKQTVEYNHTVTKPADPTREHYEFKGWYTDAEFNHSYDFETLVTEDLTLYAKWEICKYTVTFNSNGGSTVDNQIVEYGQTAMNPIAKRDGFALEYWYLTDENRAFDFNSLIVENLTLQAKWVSGKHTVFYITNGGRQIANQCVGHDATTSESVTTREHYVLTGWYMDAELNNVYNFETPVSGDLKLYAKWELCKYTVTFNCNGGSDIDSLSVEYNKTLTMPSDPVRDYYRFAGWYTDSTLKNPYDFETVVTDDMVLYAKWEKLSENNNQILTIAIIVIIALSVVCIIIGAMLLRKRQN